jgi:hypothetical protein
MVNNLVGANNIGNGAKADTATQKIHFGRATVEEYTGWPATVTKACTHAVVTVSTAAANFSINAQAVPTNASGVRFLVRKSGATNRVTCLYQAVTYQTNLATGSWLEVIYDGTKWIVIGER